jgi:hypothetical protein
MKAARCARFLQVFISIPFLTALLAGTPSPPAYAVSTEGVNRLIVDSTSSYTAAKEQDLAATFSNIAAISQETKLRRNIAQATFCLPQNILGILYYALLTISGNVVSAAEMNEVNIIVTRTPFGAALGKTIFLNESLLAEYAVRHEYGHTMQGYKHGPFYLVFEGLTSLVQAAVSLVSPSFADGYFERWPENEANELGGVTQPVVSCD